jgi:hypothetical protein
MKEQGRRGQQKQEDKRWDDLNHELFANYRRKRSRGNRLKQPATQHKETRQAKNDKYRIIAHPRIVHTEMAYMRKHYENHRESPHRIDVFYSFGCHIFCKSTEKSLDFWIFRQKILLLPYERTNQLD